MSEEKRKEPNRAVGITLPESLHKKLLSIASKTHTPLSTFIREVLAIYVEDRKKKEEK